MRFFSPGWTPQLYSPVTKTKPSAALIFCASCSRAAGAWPFGYSLYIRSSIGRLIALASINSTSSPRLAQPVDHEFGESDAHPVGTIGAVENENLAHRSFSAVRVQTIGGSPAVGEPQLMMDDVAAGLTAAAACRPAR